MAILFDKDAMSPRIAGGGNTTISIDGNDLAFCQAFSDTPPTTHVSATDIQGISDFSPIKVIPSNGAHKSGSVSVTVKEIWGLYAWEQLGIKPSAASNKFELFKWLYNQGKTFELKRLIENNDRSIVRTYKNCVMTDVKEGELNTQLSSGASDTVITFSYTSFSDAQSK